MISCDKIAILPQAALTDHAYLRAKIRFSFYCMHFACFFFYLHRKRCRACFHWLMRMIGIGRLMLYPLSTVDCQCHVM